MLRIVIPEQELWDEEKQEFISRPERVLELEHSLDSLSKWESKWCKPFLSRKEKTDEETLDYIKCMTLTQDVEPEVYDRFTVDNFRQINKYIEAPMTATTFSDDKRAKGAHEIVTAEIMFYWMIALNIPLECQYWHLNRLLALVKVCNIKNAPAKKHSKRELISRNAALNEARRKQLNTRG